VQGSNRDRGVLVVSGASSVPCLTSALVDHYQHEFSSLESLDYGITTAQKTNRGLATTAAILSYTGKPFKTLMVLTGNDKRGANKQITFDLTARKGDGPYIPCMPGILLAKKPTHREIETTGATPCVGLITLDEYLSALGDMNITWQVS